MTRTSDVLDALAPLVGDLANDIPAELRYQRLLETLCRILPCDAVALLRREGDNLAPLAVQGLSLDTLGRRFEIQAHPRLQALLEASQAMRFPPGCELPDPYDGLIEGVDGHLEVHDCMGCTLRVGNSIWGVLTLDALEADRFSRADLRLLDTFAALAAATVAAVERLQQLSLSVEDARRQADVYRLAANPARPALLGKSPAWRQMMSEIDLVAPSDLTVLVSGETGVGKELAAHQLHAQSRRAEKILISVNCAALPEHLVESELFGHVRGAFSGAVNDRLGKFEMADGGTLFLDEIGELPMGVQAKLLRALQDGQLQRVGSDRDHHVDVRLIAATNRDLAEEVRAGRFRADLYHRLSVFPLRVPPLRERGQDVLLLAGAFIEENRRRMGMRGLRLSSAAQALLLAHNWPGNVRELQYLIARATLKAKGRLALGQGGSRAEGIVSIEIEDLEIMSDAPASAGSVQRLAGQAAGRIQAAASDLRTEVDAFQRGLIEKTLETHQGNSAAAARALGLDRANLARLAGRLGLTLARRPPRP